MAASRSDSVLRGLPASAGSVVGEWLLVEPQEHGFGERGLVSAADLLLNVGEGVWIRLLLPSQGEKDLPQPFSHRH